MKSVIDYSEWNIEIVTDDQRKSLKSIYRLFGSNLIKELTRGAQSIGNRYWKEDGEHDKMDATR